MEDLVNRRCGWAGTDDLYVKYHDEEWGKLVTADKILFEFLVLESAQAGLDWLGLLFFVSVKGIKKHFIILMLRK